MRKRIFLGVLLIAAIVAPVGAQAADPVIVTGGELGPEWKAYELTSDGSSVPLTYDLKFDREPQTVGQWVFNTDGSFRNGFQYIASPARTKLEADVDVTDGIEYHVEQQGDDYDWSVKITTGLELPGIPQNPMTYIALIFTGGVTSTPATWKLTLPDPGLTLGDQTSGETLFLKPGDFDAPAKISAEAAAPPVQPLAPFGVGSRAQVVVAGRKVIDVDGVFLGQWSNTRIPGSAGYGAVYRSTVTDENGVQRDCSLGCGWQHYRDVYGAGPIGMGPGRYTFEFTGSGAGAVTGVNSYLFGMDVTFPE